MGDVIQMKAFCVVFFELVKQDCFLLWTNPSTAVLFVVFFVPKFSNLSYRAVFLYKKHVSEADIGAERSIKRITIIL